MTKPRADDPEHIAAAFAKIEAAVLAGARCPTTDQGLHPKAVKALALAGKILVEVSTQNWRRITILTGEHAGKATQPNPLKNANVYCTMDMSGTRWNGKLTGAKAKAVSLPKFNLPEPVE